MFACRHRFDALLGMELGWGGQNYRINPVTGDKGVIIIKTQWHIESISNASGLFHGGGHNGSNVYIANRP